jgi:hypothetical protein
MERSSISAAAKRAPPNPYSSRYLGGASLCEMFPGLSVRRQDLIWFCSKDYVSQLRQLVRILCA